MLRKVCTTVKNCRKLSLSSSQIPSNPGHRKRQKDPILLRFVSRIGMDFNAISTAFSLTKLPNFEPKI
jgi:hypothetical protein